MSRDDFADDPAADDDLYLEGEDLVPFPELVEYETEGNLALQIAEAGNFRQIGEIIDEVILKCVAAYLAREPGSPIVPMIRPAVEPPTNDPDQELCFYVCTGQPPARQKNIILKMREHEKIGPETAEIVINALGLKSA